MQLAYQFLERYPYNVINLETGPLVLSFLFPLPFALQEDIMLSPWENEKIMNLISSAKSAVRVVRVLANGKESILFALLAGIIFFDDPCACILSIVIRPFAFFVNIHISRVLMVEICFGCFAGRSSSL